jgi:protein TonB
MGWIRGRSLLVLALALAAGADQALAQSTQASPAPLRVGGKLKAPAKVKDVAPVYPEAAKRNRIQGVVILECTIAADGAVADVKVLRPVPELTEAAVAAVKQWRYAPTIVDGTAVPVAMSISVTFSLR